MVVVSGMTVVTHSLVTAAILAQKQLSAIAADDTVFLQRHCNIRSCVSNNLPATTYILFRCKVCTKLAETFFSYMAVSGASALHAFDIYY